jgi:outer membrane autotransporter protein
VGLISAAAIASNGGSANASGLSLQVYAVSSGVSGASAVFSGGLTNSGTIVATATASGTGGAFATGMEGNLLSYSTRSFNPGNAAFNGDIVNTGTISATATAAEGTARATAVDLSAYSFNGNFTNGGTISGTAIAPNDDAEATALSLSFYNFNGNFTNGGTISATASGYDARATAVIFGPPGFGPVTFAGDFINNGTIAATAISSGTSAAAVAQGVSAGEELELMTGSVVNSGTISATAMQTGAGDRGASATALNFYASTMFGNVSNSGTIAATASAAGTGTRAFAVATAASIGVNLMTGNVANSGIISARATQTSGDACATALAMTVYSDGSGSMSGNISNSGTISAVATAQLGKATATGLTVGVSTMLGAIINSGTISANASAANNQASAVAVNLTPVVLASFTNNGTIIAAASGTSGRATGVRVDVSTFNGTLTNSGTISATMSGNGPATAINVANLTSGALVIANSGTIAASVVTSTASAVAIDLAVSGVPVTINQTAGLITGTTAIAFSLHGDTLNASGGKIAGDLVGQAGGTMATINVAAGAGGTFTFAGTTTNIGTINVNSGTLLLATQASGAASVVNTATFTQAAGGTLGLGAMPTAISSVTASGALSLAGPLVVYEGAAGWKPGTTYTYADALVGGSLTGAFSSVGSYSPLFTASAAQAGNSETVTLGLLPLGSVPGLSGNDRSVLGAVETLLGSPNTSQSVIDTLGQIYTLPSTSAVGSFATSLSGEQNTQNFQFSVNAWNQFGNMLLGRLFGGGGEGTTGVASFSPSQGLQFAQADIPQVAQASDAAQPGMAPSRQPSQWGVWARGYGSWASAPSTASSASYDESGAGVILGGDAQISERLVGGFAFNIGSDEADISGGSRNNINTYQGALYGKYAVDPHIYVAGLAGFGWQDYDSRRFITAPISADATANYAGQGYRLYGESGYALHLSGPMPDTTVTPYIGLGYLHTHVDSFTEAGGGGAALAVGAVDADSFTTSLGARASTSLRIGNTLLKPEVRVAWQHEWLDDSTTVQSAFASAPGSVFTVTGAGFGRDSFVGGTGVSTTLAGFGVSDPRFAPTQLFIDYDVKANGGYLANVVSGGFRMQF